jgi:hypothetical protein
MDSLLAYRCLPPIESDNIIRFLSAMQWQIGLWQVTGFIMNQSLTSIRGAAHFNSSLPGICRSHAIAAVVLNRPHSKNLSFRHALIKKVKGIPEGPDLHYS